MCRLGPSHIGVLEVASKGLHHPASCRAAPLPVEGLGWIGRWLIDNIDRNAFIHRYAGLDNHQASAVACEDRDRGLGIAYVIEEPVAMDHVEALLHPVNGLKGRLDQDRVGRIWIRFRCPIVLLAFPGTFREN
jgi:hypothetical protein